MRWEKDRKKERRRRDSEIDKLSMERGRKLEREIMNGKEKVWGRCK